MADFRAALPQVIDREGGYVLVDDPDDPGGRTFAGISRRWHPGWEGWALVGRAVTDDLILAVRRFYLTEFWGPTGCAEIEDQEIAEMVFCEAVLSGPRTALALAQQAAGAPCDGLWGPATREALNGAERGRFAALFSLMRIRRYARLADRHPAKRKYFRGWVNRVLEEAFAL